MKDTAPKHKIALIVGLLLFVASPFFSYQPMLLSVLFVSYDMPEWLVRLVCEGRETSGSYGMCGELYGVLTTISALMFLSGAALVIWALRPSDEKSSN